MSRSTWLLRIVAATWERCCSAALKFQTFCVGSARYALIRLQCSQWHDTALTRRQSAGGAKGSAMRARRWWRHAARNAAAKGRRLGHGDELFRLHLQQRLGHRPDAVHPQGWRQHSDVPDVKKSPGRSTVTSSDARSAAIVDIGDARNPRLCLGGFLFLLLHRPAIQAFRSNIAINELDHRHGRCIAIADAGFQHATIGAFWPFESFGS